MFYAGLLEALTRAMGTAEGYLFRHGPRVALIALRIGRSFELSRRTQSSLFFGSTLADLGMIGLAEEAWENESPVLPPVSRAKVMQHPQRSEGIVLDIPHLETVSGLVRAHHECWDGSGYPDGLSGDEIPFEAQIIRVADCVAALEEPRRYRGAHALPEIRRVLAEGIGREFAPAVARRFLALLDAGEIGPFDQAAYERERHAALDDLLPSDVSALSAEHLLEIFGGLIDAKDAYTGGHSRRVAELSAAVAEQLGLDHESVANVHAAGHLHDIGKMTLPRTMLTRGDGLTEDEVRAMRGHSDAGAHILEAVPSLRHLAPACRHHHERWDGRGYPEGLTGERIPMLARILAVCDAYDAMTSSRAYRAALGHEAALREVVAGRGSHFAPRVAEALADLPAGTFEAVRDRPGDSTDEAPITPFPTLAGPTRPPRWAPS